MRSASRKKDPSAGLAIAVATSADAPVLVALINALASERSFLFINPVDPVDGVAVLRNHLDAIAASGNEVVIVARAGDDLVGLVTGIRGTHPARRGVIDIGLGVRPEYRRRGIGRALMQAIERWAREMGCHRLHLSVTTDNMPAFELYRRCGFLVEGVLHAASCVDGRYHDDLQMAKLLHSER